MFGRGSAGTNFTALLPDDLHSVEFAASGLDELRFTADDYTVELQYDADCLNPGADIVVYLGDADPDILATCFPEFTALPGTPVRHYALTSTPHRAGIRLNRHVPWDVQLLFAGDFDVGDTSQWSFTQP